MHKYNEKQKPFIQIKDAFDLINNLSEDRSISLTCKTVTNIQLASTIHRCLEDINSQYAKKSELLHLHEKLELVSQLLVDSIFKAQITYSTGSLVQDSKVVNEGVIIIEDSEVAEYKLSKVIKALSDPKWHFRTIQGIEKDTGLSKNEIKTILIDNKDVIRKSVVPDKHRNSLYTLRSQPIRIRERFAEFYFYLNKYFT